MNYSIEQYKRGVLTLKRDRVDEDYVMEELADVRIMYEQLARFFGLDQVEETIDWKLDRLRERLDEE